MELRLIQGGANAQPQAPSPPAPDVSATDAGDPVTLYLLSLRDGDSRRSMASALATVARLLTHGRLSDPSLIDWAHLEPRHSARLRHALGAGFSPSYANRLLAAYRGVLRAAWRLGWMPSEDYQRLVDIAPLKGTRLPRGRHLGRDELSALLEACRADPSVAGRRDAALIALLAATGLRRAEVVSLQLEDWDPDSETLRVIGKGDRERDAYLLGSARSYLEEWLAVRGDRPGPLLVSLRPAARGTEPRPLHPSSLPRILDRRAAEAAEVATPPRPHDFRRTFVGELLDRGNDLVTVSALAGHANVTTTARYDRRPAEARRRAAETLDVPWR